ncbi:hypothetical protein HQ544_03550 [Candidatus Falkowbacteria bacterium]|nr:hypothetical protein [Candidatus Falkowbacteria bacterium]
MSKIFKFGHRGASGHFPENTMLAFNKALEMGCDGVELDGSFTSDGHVVIIHDETLDRTTNGKGLVIETSLKNIQKLDAGQKEKVPTMEHTLDWAKQKSCLVNFEIKDSNMVDKVAHAIISRRLQNQVFVTSFLHPEIVKLKNKNPGLKAGFIFDHYPLRPFQIVKQAKENNLTVLSMKAEWVFKWVGENIIDLAHDAGLKVHIWGANDKSSVSRMQAMNVDAIITNYPELL